MYRTTLSSKGQIVIPKDVRETLEFSPGLNFRVYKEGRRVILVPEEDDPIKAGAGFLKGLLGDDDDK